MIKLSDTTLMCSDSAWNGMRLDKFLFAQFPDYSRNYFQELIDQGLILVNDHVGKCNYHIKQGDTIHISFRSKEYNLKPMPVDFQVIDEQEDFLVINKPAGLVVHPNPATPDEVTLVNGLLYRFDQMHAFEEKERPGIVHRLDKNTSGLLLVARNQQAQIELSTMFKEHQIHKTYVALVTRHPDSTGTIDLPIGRHVTERHKMTVFGIQARPALTHFKVLAWYEGCALVAANIVTGRTHQIRVHFASMGHPIIGDFVYGESSKLIDRQALHAWHISFEFKGKQYSYCCPIPNDFKELLKAIGPKKCNK